jgi:hypothetical protein
MLDYEKYLFHKVHNSLMKKLKSNIEKNNFLNTTDIYLCDRSFIAEMRVRGTGGGWGLQDCTVPALQYFWEI